MNLSPAWIDALNSAGHETKHWSSIGSNDAPDTEIMEWARQNQYTVFTHDLDFSSLLFSTNALSPSVIQLRIEDIRPQSSSKIVLAALQDAEEAIKQGALITVDPRKSRIRLLPLQQHTV